MTTCIICFLTAFVLAVALVRVVQRLARRVGAVDVPDSFRRLHAGEIPRLGGVAIFLAFLAPIVALHFFNPYVLSLLLSKHQLEVLGCILGGTVALAIGVADDIREMRPGTKLLLQLLPAGIAFATGCTIGSVSLPFVGSVSLGWLTLPITLLWFLGCMNAVNFLDGLDGLAAGVTFFVTLTLFLVGLLFSNMSSMLLMACLGGAILGFLIFNFHPAKIFLGDSGSMLLGFLVAALSVMASRKAETTVALLIPVVALGLPIMDTSLAILRRLSRRLPIEAADRQHIHHMLVSMGLSHRRTVLILYSVCVALGLSALLITFERSEVTLSVLGALLLMAFVCARVFGRLSIGEMFVRLARERRARQRGTAATLSVEKSVQMMDQADSPSRLWEICSQAFERLGLDYAHLRLYGEEGMEYDPTLRWDRDGSGRGGGTNGHQDKWWATLSVRRNGCVYGRLEVCKSMNGQPFLSRTPELLERLHHEIGVHIERLSRDRVDGTKADMQRELVAVE